MLNTQTDAARPAETALNEARGRFIASFPDKYNELRSLAQSLDSGEGAQLLHSGTRTAHRLVGLAGTVGFPSVSRHALELEELLRQVAGGDESARRALAGALVHESSRLRRQRSVFVRSA